MTARELDVSVIGMPVFPIATVVEGSAFDLSSHQRAREALAFGLDAPGTDYNVYVLGPDRSGRMNATRQFAHEWVQNKAVPDDWIYVFNFDSPSTPRPIRLPAGLGRHVKDAVDHVVPAFAREIATAFGSEPYQQQIGNWRARGEENIQGRLRQLDADAERAGLSILNTPQGAIVAARSPDGSPVPIGLVPAEQRGELEGHSRHLMEQMQEINRDAARFQRELFEKVNSLNREVASRATVGLMSGLIERFGAVAELKEWLERMQADVAEHYEMFIAAEGGIPVPRTDRVERRYAINLLVDRTGETTPSVVIEHNPTYENLFGIIEYRQLPGGGLETDVGLIRAGALHRANGGVLILRAEAIVSQPFLWAHLKAALRDREIRIEEFYRASSPPIAGAPKPMPVPLDINVVIVGAPRWYYAFFALDPEFAIYFKVKAEIEPVAEANDENIARYAGLLRKSARQNGIEVDDSALQRLLAMASRWAENRWRLTSRFEMVADLLIEASKQQGGRATVDGELVKRAIEVRRRRNSQVEDRLQDAICEGTILIRTYGSVVGQINGLTVQFVGDHTFGAPSRITARSSVGRRGVINIERLVEMSGPIAQKGTWVLQGILMRRFAHRFPLSFDCSVTFEQLYAGVEGDSASLAEYIAIVSELADVPIRQDLAITGSVNQLGEAQVIGGLHHKVEGYFRTCSSCGALTGTQGVVIPRPNAVNLVLRDEVRDAVAAGQFHIYTVERVEDAIELLTGVPAGVLDATGEYPPDSVYGRVVTTLERFDRTLAERGI
jgi:predicted ATP-dependent protease